ERIGVGFGVLVPPVRPLPLTAAQIATVQHLSGGRVRLLGVGAGGFPQSPFWPASGAPAAGRGARLDAAIDALPGLLAGRPTAPGPGLPEVSLAPGVPVPPILVGGGDTEKTLARAARADGWLPSLMPPRRFAAGVRRLTELAGGRPAPHALIGGHVLLGPDSEIAPARDALVRSLVDEHGMDPADAAEAPMAGSPKQVAERLAEYREAGATGVAVSLDGDDWPRLAELFAEALALPA
ncbi:LLM class flavin-dependent oxidoreductase, partial [Nocardiopsis composta]